MEEKSSDIEKLQMLFFRPADKLERLHMKFMRIFVLILALFISHTTSVIAQSWQPLSDQPFISASVPILLTDGTVIVHDADSPEWWRLTPDDSGNYINGTWSQCASMPSGYAPLYFASAVLSDGRVVAFGGEYNGGDTLVETNLGAIYDPIKDIWSPLSGPRWPKIGDAPCVVLPDGRFMMGHIYDSVSAILDPVTLTWSPGGTGKAYRFAEEGWTLLPQGTVLTVDVLNTPGTEKYFPSSNTWVSAGQTLASLVDLNAQEIGPAVLRPNGTVFAVGGTNHTGIYTPGKTISDPGTWTLGPVFPTIDGHSNLDEADGPACLLPNGNVLVSASPGVYQSPVYFFEFDGTHLNQVPATPNSPTNTSYYGNMLMLPTGQVLYTDFSNDIEIYTPSGTPQNAWRPTITNCPTSVIPGNTYVIQGTQFNGLSQCSAYGDDTSNATNYPLVRITNRFSGHVQYCRTSNHSTMGVATGATPTSTHFTLPDTSETGISTLEVVANGLPSSPYTLNVKTATYLRLNASSAMVGQDDNLSAKLALDSNTPVSGRLLMFSINGITIGADSTDINGVVKIVYKIPQTLGAGVKTVTVSFAGDSQFAASTQNASLTVLRTFDAIGLGPVTAKGGKILYSGARLITFNGLSIVGRNVDFDIDGVKIGTIVTDSNGGARLYYLLPQETPSGSHTLTASFAGDSDYKPVSKTVTLTVQLSSTSIVVYPQSGSPGQVKSLQCRLYNETGRVAVNRTVSYSIGGNIIGTAVTSTLGYAGLNYTVPDTLGAGAQKITVNFAGDTVYSSSSGTGTLTITKANSNLYMVDTTINIGQLLRLPVRLSGSSGNYLGGRTISLVVNGAAAGTAVTQSNGSTGFTYILPAGTVAGTYTMTVSFAGDSLYNASAMSKSLVIK